MHEGWNERHQLLLRVVGMAVWWIASLLMDQKSRDGFEPMSVIRTFPRFEYLPGEKRHPKDENES